MDKNSIDLINIFRKVAAKDWIKSVAKSWGNVGLTFENEIGKLPDSDYKPDFNDIEIKCTSRYSNYPLYLFTIAFDGPGENEIKRITDIYGYNDVDFKDRKVLFKKVTNTIVEKNKYNFFFDVDRVNERIYLKVYNSDGELLEKISYISFDSLKTHINTKLKNIAYIKASKRKVIDEIYFRYYYLSLLKFKSFETFLDLLEKNLINASIVSRISKSGNDTGRYRNKNVVFSIYKEKIPLLFDEYYHYNHDEV